MIRVAKNLNAPQSLSTTKAYDGEDVKKQLLADHRDKCYLCERFLCTDFEIEHHKSKTHYPHLIQDWNNLYLTCRYCNGKKSEDFDNTLHPATINIEDEIKHDIDFENKRAIFTSMVNELPEHQETIELLMRIYNGTGKIRKIKEERFFEYIIGKINDFLKLILDYQNNNSIESEESIRSELQIDKECLGFKYWIIKNHPQLSVTFANDIVWNKR